MRAEEMSDLIQSAMPQARVMVRGDDGAHFEAIIVAPDFRGLARLKRHQHGLRSPGRGHGRSYTRPDDADVDTGRVC
ncbi:MAG: BolA family transcriptional regulator [Gammaproteobacteria bacterium]